MSDPRIPEAWQGLQRLDRQIRSADARRDHEHMRSLTARRYALWAFLDNNGHTAPPPPVNW